MGGIDELELYENADDAKLKTKRGQLGSLTWSPTNSYEDDANAIAKNSKVFWNSFFGNYDTQRRVRKDSEVEKNVIR